MVKIEIPPHLLREELQHAASITLGSPVNLECSREDYYLASLGFLPPEEVLGGPVNAMRKELMDFMEEYHDQLSLHCDSNCNAHSDARVYSCYLQYQEDIDPHNITQAKGFK